jgi:hypothetical protein
VPIFLALRINNLPQTGKRQYENEIACGRAANSKRTDLRRDLGAGRNSTCWMRCNIAKRFSLFAMYDLKPGGRPAVYIGAASIPE